MEEGEEGEENWDKEEKHVFILFFSSFSLLAPSPLAVERCGLIVNMKTRLRMPRALLLVFNHVYFNFSCFIPFF